MDEQEKRLIQTGHYLVLLPCERNSGGVLEWTFYHVGYQKKLKVEQGDLWFGRLDSFMESLDDREKVE